VGLTNFDAAHLRIATVRAEIAETLSTLTPIPGDTGDEYRKKPYLTASGDLRHHLQSIPAPYKVREDGRGTDPLPERQTIGGISP
jgi:hypothetical protein